MKLLNPAPVRIYLSIRLIRMYEAYIYLSSPPIHSNPNSAAPPPPRIQKQRKKGNRNREAHAHGRKPRRSRVVPDRRPQIDRSDQDDGLHGSPSWEGRAGSATTCAGGMTSWRRRASASPASQEDRDHRRRPRLSDLRYRPLGGSTVGQQKMAWKPPPEGKVKINLDGRFAATHGYGAGAAVIRDHQGRVLAGQSRWYGPVQEA